MASLLVITPTLGASRYLAETIASVRRLTVAARHVLVCPRQLRSAVADAWPDLEVVADDSGGLYAAINRGFAELRSETWVTYINDDDCLEPVGFSQFFRRVEQGSGGIAYGRVRLMDERGDPMGELPIARRPADLLALFARGKVGLAQPGTVIHRSTWKQVGPFDATLRYAGDLDFFVRALLGQTAFQYVGRCVASFRLHPGQLSKNRLPAEAEAQCIFAGLRANPAIDGRGWAEFRFRLGNWRSYLERIRRHGFVTMRTLYGRESAQ